MPIANVSFVGADQLLDLILEEEGRSGKPMRTNLINSQVVFSYKDDSNIMATDYRRAMDRYKPGTPEIADASYTPKHEYSFGSLEGYLSARAFLAVLQATPDPLTREGFIKTAEEMGPLRAGHRGRDAVLPRAAPGLERGLVDLRDRARLAARGAELPPRLTVSPPARR